MAEKKRQCGTCRFFITTDIAGQGKCSHPLRKDTELVLIRPSELACRTQWGGSLWQDPADESDPNVPKPQQQPDLPEPIAAQRHFDDEVTSVSIAGSKTSRSSLEDDVVDTGSIAPDREDWQDPLQQERFNLLNRSPRDAVAGARKRQLDKQERHREMVPFAEEDSQADADHESTPAASSEQDQSEIVKDAPRFAPDDFVEDVRVSTNHESSHDDSLIDEGTGVHDNRSPRLRNLLRESDRPKKHEAMSFTMPTEMHVTSHNPDKRETWNTVPAIDPAFELPLNVTAPKPATTSFKMSASAAPMAVHSSSNQRTVSQARELISEDRQRQGRAQRQMIVPLIDSDIVATSPTSPLLEDLPSPEPLARDTTLAQVKASPLRGYRPAKQRVVEPTVQPERSQQEPNKQSLRVESTHSPQDHTAYDASPQPHISTQQVHERIQKPQRVPQAPETPRQRRPSAPAQRLVPHTPFKPQKIAISPGVSRQCATCASFRPSAVEGRGSCSNAFAGPVQRVVYDDDLACQRTYGSFWLPADEEVWLEEINDSYPPTPRVDAMIERKKRRETIVLPDLDEMTS